MLGGPAASMQIDVAGPKTANSETSLLLEFGPDGNGRSDPAPDPGLSPAATFTVSASFGGSRVFSLGGGSEERVFAGKLVAFQHLDPPNAPGLYALSIVHLQDVPVGAVETWTVRIEGLPARGGRVIASIRQGNFRSLSPTGPVPRPPSIGLLPPPLAAGAVSSLVVRSFDGLDLSHLSSEMLEIVPPNDVSVRSVGNASPNTAIVSVDIGRCAAGGERTLVIHGQDTSASTIFAVTAAQDASISVVPNGVINFSSAMLNVAASGCLNLSDLTPAQVLIEPSDGISDIAVTVLSATSANVAFEVAENVQMGTHTLSIVKGGLRATDKFLVARHPPPHSGACGAGQKCCGQTDHGSCAGSCIPRSQHC
ncbi:hypothetical protein [Bradyrhizobium sp. HKCCYLS20291]|uniref:hypothetical protein n=1 Tax=Bradyrhizobium sp. HKCCYLS20291 TaxID=3420766 RepID=UPI003EBB98C2